MTDTPSTPINLLIIEDDPFLRDALQTHLQKQGEFNIRIAETVKAGLKHFEEREPDVVFLDLIMPDMDGREFLREIQNRGSKCPVLVATNLDREGVREECMRNGATAFVVKSNTSLTEFVGIISACARGEDITDRV